MSLCERCNTLEYRIRKLAEELEASRAIARRYREFEDMRDKETRELHAKLATALEENAALKARGVGTQKPLFGGTR